MAEDRTLAHGVRVKVPNQSKRMKIETRPIPGNMPGKLGGFAPGRVLENFVVVERDNPSRLVTKFNPPLKLEVAYTKADADRARAKNTTLRLGFWNGSAWVRFTSKHKFRLVEDGNGGGTAFVEIKDWGDPPLAWSP